jgi:hypothetical protein
MIRVDALAALTSPRPGGSRRAATDMTEGRLAMVNWFRERWRGVLVVGVAVLVTSALVAGGVLAQTPPAPTPATPPKPGAAKSIGPLETFVNKLAARLGITPDRLTTEAKNVQKEMIDEAVAAGRISKEAGEAMKQRIDAGRFGWPAGPHGHGKPPVGRPGAALAGLREGFQAIAGFLGITPEQLRQELPGKSLAQVAQNHGKTRQQLIDFLVGEYTKRVNQAVQDGRLTQARANQLIEQFKQHVGALVDRTFPTGPGPRGVRAFPGAPKPTPTPAGNA